jgi:hypothetical protein
MATIAYNSGHKTVLDRLLLEYPAVHAGKMFGFPAYYAGKKLCICLYEDGVGIKLPEATAARLLQTDPHVIPFRPLGKARMREWVQINLPRSEDYRQYVSVFEEAVQYVLTVQQMAPD